jgi:hypothetical protein
MNPTEKDITWIVSRLAHLEARVRLLRAVSGPKLSETEVASLARTIQGQWANELEEPPPAGMDVIRAALKN